MLVGDWVATIPKADIAAVREIWGRGLFFSVCLSLGAYAVGLVMGEHVGGEGWRQVCSS